MRFFLALFFLCKFSYADILLNLDPLILADIVPNMHFFEEQQFDKNLDQLWMSAHLQANYEERLEQMTREYMEKMDAIDPPEKGDKDSGKEKEKKIAPPQPPIHISKVTKSQIKAIRRHLNHHMHLFSIDGITEFDAFMHSFQNLQSAIFRGDAEQLYNDLLKLIKEYHRLVLLSFALENNNDNHFNESIEQMISDMLLSTQQEQIITSQITALQQIPSELSSFVEITERIRNKHGKSVEGLKNWIIYCDRALEFLTHLNFMGSVLSERLQMAQILNTLRQQMHADYYQLLQIDLLQLQQNMHTTLQLCSSSLEAVPESSESSDSYIDHHTTSRNSSRSKWRGLTRKKTKREISSRSRESSTSKSESGDSQKIL